MNVSPIRRESAPDPDHVVARKAAEAAGRQLVDGLLAQAEALSAGLDQAKAVLGVAPGVVNELRSLNMDLRRRLQVIQDIRRQTNS